MRDRITRAKEEAKALGDVPTQLAALERMTVGQLSEKYRELYGEPTRSRNVAYLRKRLAWRIQELAEGGLTPSTLAKLMELGDGLPERWRMRQAETVPAMPPTTPAPATRDPRLPPVGTVLTRVFNGTSHQVTIRDDGFEHGEQTFRTLSAVARHISGTPWNGFTFFGLTQARAQP